MRLTGEKQSEKFFKVFQDRLKEAQSEIKSATATSVNQNIAIQPGSQSSVPGTLTGDSVSGNQAQAASSTSAAPPRRADDAASSGSGAGAAGAAQDENSPKKCLRLGLLLMANRLLFVICYYY